MVAGALKQVGVEAVVESLGKFMSDVETMNKGIGSIGDQGNLLTRTLDGLGNMFSWLGGRIVDVATYALGQLLADAIEAVLSKIRELISAVFEAGSQFQILELRLNRLNFNDVADSTEMFDSAMETAIDLTKEQMSWLQKLAVQTPYDAQDIANVFTLAKSYGFASDSAKGLTEDITNFAAGMGLGNTEIQRIIVNFGQMVQQGKVTQREMNDLARGAFVPVNDILKRMQENVGMSDAAFKEFRMTGEGVNEFMKAFSQVVQDRFQGAAQGMARTFQGATANAQDFLKSLLGFNIVRPILDQLGGGLADFINQLTAEGNWDRLNEAAARVGEGFSQILGIFQHVMGLDLSGLADGLIGGLNGIADWIAEHRTDIYNFFIGIRKTVEQKVIPFLTETLPGALKKFGDWFLQNGPGIAAFFEGVRRNAERVANWIGKNVVTAFNAIRDWVTENRPLIEEFFSTLGKIVNTVIYDLTHIDVSGGGLQAFLDGIGGFMQLVIDNAESIANFIEYMIKLRVVFELIAIGVTVVVGAITLLIAAIGLLIFGGILALIEIGGLVIDWVSSLITKFQEWQLAMQTWREGAISAVTEFFLAIGTGFAEFQAGIQAWREEAIVQLTGFFETGIAKFGEFKEGVASTFTEIYDSIKGAINKVVAVVQGAPWGTLGRDIIHGMATGVLHAVQGLIDAVVSAIKQAIEAARAALNAKSPSRVFMEIGEDTMKGMAIGIKNMAGLAQKSMETAIGQVTLPALVQQYALAPSTVNNQNSYTNNFNMTVNSQAKAEPILQDFNMMKSIIGA